MKTRILLLSAFALIFAACGAKKQDVGDLNYKSKIISVDLKQDVDYVGRGNQNEVILKMVINASENVDLKKMVINMNGTTEISDVANIKIFASDNGYSFDYRKPNAELVAIAKSEKGNVTIKTKKTLIKGNNTLWLTYDIKDSAKEGNKVDASILSLYTSKGKFEMISGNPEGAREILLKRVLVYAPNDYNSKNYRIPAITTAADGSLVIITDKRKFNSVDLPEDIDLVANRSVDGGKTWSEPILIAKGTGKGKGYGDAVIISAKSGKLVAVFVGGKGLWTSTPADPIRTYVSTSSDNGLTWTAPYDITNQLFGAECSDEVRSKWMASFCGSGHGLCTRNGRIMVVAAVRETGANHKLNNYIYYSDDEGKTWNVSKLAIEGGDEAKVVELNNGNILLSSRTKGNRLWAISKDNGVTWGEKNSWKDLYGNACDADVIRYTSTKDGYDKDRLLHSLVNHENRQNVSVFLSYDEGKTWPINKTICPGTSAYSSMTILPDGTIGVYLEEDESVPYKMYYLNFSLDWLTNGADKFVKK